MGKWLRKRLLDALFARDRAVAIVAVLLWLALQALAACLLLGEWWAAVDEVLVGAIAVKMFGTFSSPGLFPVTSVYGAVRWLAVVRGEVIGMAQHPFKWAVVAGLALCVRAATGAEFPDLAKVDRSPPKEPAYLAKPPLYGLAVFGAKAEKRVWMVLDKSKADADKYDVLHIDLDADGDLTGSGERLTLAEDGKFQVGDYKDPATGASHGEFTVRPDPENKCVMLSLRWRGQYKFGGGYPEDPESGYMAFTAKPADAPVVWMFGDAPFRFQRWYSDKLTIGGGSDLKVFLGQPGRGPNTFSATQEHILPPGQVVRATLVYTDAAGKEQRAVCELKERC